MTLFLVYEAVQRVIDPPKVVGFWMLVTAVGGLFFNIIQMRILHNDDGGYDLGTNEEKEVKAEKAKTIGQALTPLVPRVTPGSIKRTRVTETPKPPRVRDSQKDLVREPLKEESSAKEEDPDNEVQRKQGEQRNINVESAALHVLGDLLMSLGVVIAAIIIYFKPEWHLADPACTFMFSIIICFTSFPVIAKCIHVLMEGAPKDIDIEKLHEDIQMLDLVDEVHDLHLWSITMDKHSLTVHLKSEKPMKALRATTEMIRKKYEIYQTTIQVEGPDGNPHQF